MAAVNATDSSPSLPGVWEDSFLFGLGLSQGFGTVCGEGKQPPEGHAGLSAFHVAVCLRD